MTFPKHFNGKPNMTLALLRVRISNGPSEDGGLGCTRGSPWIALISVEAIGVYRKVFAGVRIAVYSPGLGEHAPPGPSASAVGRGGSASVQRAQVRAALPAVLVVQLG